MVFLSEPCMLHYYQQEIPQALLELNSIICEYTLCRPVKGLQNHLFTPHSQTGGENHQSGIR